MGDDAACSDPGPLQQRACGPEAPAVRPVREKASGSVLQGVRDDPMQAVFIAGGFGCRLQEQTPPLNACRNAALLSLCTPGCYAVISPASQHAFAWCSCLTSPSDEDFSASPPSGHECHSTRLPFCASLFESRFRLAWPVTRDPLQSHADRGSKKHVIESLEGAFLSQPPPHAQLSSGSLLSLPSASTDPLPHRRKIIAYTAI